VTKDGTVVSSYLYDPDGFRVEKMGSQGRIDYVPVLNGEVGYRKEFTSGKEYSWVYVGGTKLARVDGTIGSTGAKYFYANDHQGSCMVITDGNGNKVVQKDHSPFGERITVNLDESFDTEEAADEFTGKEFDSDVGLYYYNARWYDEDIGRFISEDSVVDPNNPNEYAYCGSNPVDNDDPTGHLSFGLQSGFGLVGAMFNAVAVLSNSEALGNISSMFGLFVAVNNYIQKAQEAAWEKAAAEAAAKAAKTPPTPADQAEFGNGSSNPGDTPSSGVTSNSANTSAPNSDTSGTANSSNVPVIPGVTKNAINSGDQTQQSAGDINDILINDIISGNYTGESLSPNSNSNKSINSPTKNNAINPSVKTSNPRLNAQLSQ